MIHQIYVAATLGNIVLLLVLIYIFWQSYREIHSEFTLGLVIFALILLINAILSCPVLYPVFGISSLCPEELFPAMASVFEFLALAVLLYLVRE